MDDAQGVGRIETVGDLDGEIDEQPGFERPLRHQRRNGLAVHQLHDDELAAVMFGDLVDGADVGVVQTRGGPRFVEHPPAVQCP